MYCPPFNIVYSKFFGFFLFQHEKSMSKHCFSQCFDILFFYFSFEIMKFEPMHSKHHFLKQ